MFKSSWIEKGVNSSNIFVNVLERHEMSFCINRLY